MYTDDNGSNFMVEIIKSTAEENKFALVVGVNNSAVSSSLPPLEYAEVDAQDIYGILRQTACKFHFPTLVLLGHEAKTENVRSAVIKLVEEKTDQDFLLFYFIGHAQPVKLRDGRSDIYFVTYNFDPNAVRIDASSHLSMSWLREILYRFSDAGKVLIILDCCYAGNMIEARPHPDRIHIEVDIRKIVEECLGGPGINYQNGRLRVILTATGYNTPAQERAMTSLILSALQGKAPKSMDDEGNVNIHSLYTYLQNQMPQVQLPNLSGDFPRTCILAQYPEKSRNYLEQLQKAEEDERWDKVSKLMVEVSSIITDPDYFKKHTTTDHVLAFDCSICPDASLEDLESAATTDFFTKDRVQQQRDYQPSISIQEHLQNFGLLRKTHPTYGALLCFGQNPQAWLPSAYVHCTYWHGNNRLTKSKADQLYRGNLLRQFESSRDFLQKHLQLSRVFSREGRSEQWEIPFVALEEALANALIHREYTNRTDCICVEVFDDRVEISSPGDLPPPMTERLLYEKHRSCPRNPDIVRVFYLYGHVEHSGSGIERMQNVLKDAGLPPAELKQTEEKRFDVLIHRPSQHTQTDDRTGQQLNNYLLTGILTRGKPADIYLGEQVRLNKQVLIKILQARLPEDKHKEFFDEASALTLLVNPHIVRTLDFFIYEDVPFLVTEYIRGKNLRTLHGQGTILALETVVAYVNQVAEALQYAHDQNRLHRNVKPENMLVGQRGEILLSDFSITLPQSLEPQQTEAAFGAVTYMAPEQFQGRSSAASDQYALAIVVYEWLSGSPPFNGTHDEIIAQHKYEPPPSLQGRAPRITQAIEQAVTRALAKDPNQRFANVHAFADALEQACKTVSSHPSVLQSTASPPSQSSTLLPLEKKAPRPKIGRLFEVDRHYLNARKHRVFRPMGITLNVISSIFLGISLTSWWLFSLATILTLLTFIGCIIAVKRAVAIFLGVLLALYWGLIGFVVGEMFRSLAFLSSLPVPTMMGIIFLAVSAFVFIRYARNKDLL